MTLIYLGDDLLDLDPKVVISITIQAVNAGDLKTRNVSYTNQFKIPATENNCRLFGYSNEEWSRSTKPYRFNDCKIVQNGIETLKGTLVIKNFDSVNFNVNIFEELFDIFKALEGKKLKDINPIPDSEWDAEAIDNARNTTSGIISAVVQWGKGDAIYNSDFFLPSFYYHTLIKKILTYTGLTLSGGILIDTKFLDLVVPFCGDTFEVPGVTTYDIVLEYAEAVTGTPSWSARFEIVSPFTRKGLTVTGNGDSDSSTIRANDTQVICTVYKTSNGGVVQDAGDVSFYLNGSLVDTQSFIVPNNVSITSPKQYTFIDLVVNDELKVIITEG